jgi:hypothetical protein
LWQPFTTLIAEAHLRHCCYASKALSFCQTTISLVTVRRSLAFKRDAQHLRLMKIQTMMWCCPLVIRGS